MELGKESITQFIDHEIMRKLKHDFSIELLLQRSNPLQQKYFDLTRVADESIARELKPTQEQDKELEEIINQPDFKEMLQNQQAIIFRFRYSLKEKPKALVKFLQSARLDDEDQRKEAMNLFNSWTTLKKEDALPLLSLKFAANKIYNENLATNVQLIDVYNEIRNKAVKSLEKESISDIASIMLQLVQAYRYESFHQSPLKKFLLKKVFDNITIANKFHWLVHLDKENNENDEFIQKQYKDLYDKFMEILEEDYDEFY